MPAAAIIGAGVLGAGASIISSSSAASAQENASAQASATQKAMYDQTRTDLQPYNKFGITSGVDPLASRMNDLTQPFNMSQANLEQTPGYQWNMAQGLKAVQNSASARGLGVSGDAMKGAATYASGLADSTYQNQFNNYQTNQTNAYSKLMGNAQLGQNSAAQVGAYGTQTAAGIAQNQIGAGNAAAGAYMSGGNAISNAANGVGNMYLMNAIMKGGGVGNGKGLFGN